MMLSVRDLCKSYVRPRESVVALAGVSLDIAEGELVAVRGPSGCGKTTLLLAIGGLLAPDAGVVEVCGQNPYSLAPNHRAAFRAATVGFVFQQFHLVPYLSVLENVMAPVLARPVPDAEGQARGLLEQFGLAERSTHLPGELSTGERQRTALARAMLSSPKLILADEPTGNLDEDNARDVLTSLADFAKSGGAVLLVTHDSAVAGHADRTLQMESGRLREPPDGALLCLGRAAEH